MKKLSITAIAILVMISAIAQAPDKMSYQAVIRNSSNSLVTNTMVGMKISILQGSASGAIAYIETHSPTTNINGLASIEIGNGTIVSGSFSEIDWENGPYFIKTEADPEGGSNYTISGVSQLLSVPYALYAEMAGTAPGGGQTVIQNDSLVLKDSFGVTRMVLNPNTGTFKMMNNDTTWYNISVSSPKFESYQIGPDKYITQKILENGNQVWEMYQGGNLIARQTESQDYDGSFYEETSTQIIEEFAYNPNTGFFELAKKTENIDVVSVLDDRKNENTTTETVYKDGQQYESSTNIRKVLKSPFPESTETITNERYDSQGILMGETMVVKDFINHTQKKYIKDFIGATELYVLVEEKILPAANECSTSVTDALGNGTTTTQTTDKVACSHSNPNAKGIEYTYDNATNSTQINYVDNSGNKKLLSKVDHLGNVYYGPIKTNYLGETFLSGNTFVTGDLVVTDNNTTYGSTNAWGTTTLHNNLTGTNASFSGNLNVAGTKNFRIIHPEDSSKYLLHAALESNEVLNVYSGNIITDRQGMATVSLPGYFDEINTDYRYVLTVVGKKFAQAIVFQEIDSNNQFIVKTNEPNIKVSWQVTARRNDEYMQSNPFEEVVDK